MRLWTETRVECYAGYRRDEAPRCFWVAGHDIAVTDIQKQWIEPGYRCFRVAGDDGGTYILRQDRVSYGWEVSGR